MLIQSKYSKYHMGHTCTNKGFCFAYGWFFVPDDAVLTHVWFRMIKIVFGRLYVDLENREGI